MIKSIVTTTINPPTEALIKFAKIAQKDGWNLIIVGDKKTNDAAYEQFCKDYSPQVTYLDAEWQADTYPELSELIGWNCIQRRNIGLLHAYKIGSEIIATVDDDNIPYEGWGQNCQVGKVAEIAMVKPNTPVFDPVSFPLNDAALWHRGFPIQMLGKRQVNPAGVTKRKVLVQADLWDGDPDIDAICRIALRPTVTFPKEMRPFCASVIAPFNSQNTFLSREVFPAYFLFPHIGRMDDIFAAYVTQFEHPDSVIFSKASVFQERNDHDLTKDLEAEMIGYKHAADFVAAGKDGYHNYLPEKALEAYQQWHREIESV